MARAKGFSSFSQFKAAQDGEDDSRGGSSDESVEVGEGIVGAAPDEMEVDREKSREIQDSEYEATEATDDSDEGSLEGSDEESDVDIATPSDQGSEIISPTDTTSPRTRAMLQRTRLRESLPPRAESLPLSMPSSHVVMTSNLQERAAVSEEAPTISNDIMEVASRALQNVVKLSPPATEDVVEVASRVLGEIVKSTPPAPRDVVDVALPALRDVVEVASPAPRDAMEVATTPSPKRVVESAPPTPKHVLGSATNGTSPKGPASPARKPLPVARVPMNAGTPDTAPARSAIPAASHSTTSPTTKHTAQTNSPSFTTVSVNTAGRTPLPPLTMPAGQPTQQSKRSSPFSSLSQKRSSPQLANQLRDSSFSSPALSFRSISSPRNGTPTVGELQRFYLSEYEGPGVQWSAGQSSVHLIMDIDGMTKTAKAAQGQPVSLEIDPKRVANHNQYRDRPEAGKHTLTLTMRDGETGALREHRLVFDSHGGVAASRQARRFFSWISGW